MHRRLLLVLALPALGLIAQPAAAEVDFAALRTSVRTAHLEPGYAALSGAARQLKTAIDQHCKGGPESAEPEAARQAFHTALDAWQTVQHIRSGPIEDSDGHARLQFWPDKRGITERHLRQFLASPANPDLDAAMPDMSVAIQGFPALERLLFGNAPLSRHPINGEQTDRCSIARAIGVNIATIAETLRTETRADNPSVEAKAGVSAIFNDLITGLKFVQWDKLKEPVDSAKPKPHRLENWRTQRSLRNIEINLRAMQQLYTLLYARSDLEGDANTAILGLFEKAISDVHGNGESGVAVLAKADGASRFLALSRSVELLRERMAPALSTVLNVSLGFNSLDGD